MNNILFQGRAGSVSAGQMKEALQAVGAADCDVLYVHTGISFGLPAIRRGQLLAELLGVLESLGTETLVFPTFTFSFCNNEVFDVQKTPTPMGAINEFARRSGRGKRSADPLLSIYVLGKDPGLVENLSEFSIGRGSSYDRLHACGREVKFLFFGTDMRNCFTYTHYMEAIAGVPYRYDREFNGTIINNGREYAARVYLYSTYGNCRLNPAPVVHDAMQRAGMLKKGIIGDGSICCFAEKDGYATLAELLHEDPYCLTDGSFDPSRKNTDYNPSGTRVVSVL